MVADGSPSRDLNDMKYPGFYKVFQVLRDRIRQAQISASSAVNTQMIQLYWEIGLLLLQRSKKAKWGEGALTLLSRELRREFPGSKGYSTTNLYEMRLLAKCYTDGLPKSVTLIPWGHLKHLLHRVHTDNERIWYAQQAVEQGWSRSVLEFYIDGDLYAREGKAITNFQQTLPAPQSDLAQQITRDPYCFDFLTLRKDYIEKELEAGLTEHVRKMLMALGKGFAYVGTQYHLEVGGVDYYVDMLFYHLKLHCYCVIELKATDFKPAYAGQLNFYLSAIDDLVREPGDNPTIGMILCRGKDSFTVEYSLRNIGTPMGVSSYTTSITDELPQDLESSLPSREELAARLDRDFLEGDEDETAQEEQGVKAEQPTPTD